MERSQSVPGSGGSVARLRADGRLRRPGIGTGAGHRGSGDVHRDVEQVGVAAAEHDALER